MPVLYDGNALIPAPFFSCSREKIRREDGKEIGGVYAITVRGKLVAAKGSPRTDGSFWTSPGYPADESVAADSRLTALLKKENALRGLFAVDGRSFEVSGYDGFAPFRCNPRIRNVEIPDGEGRGGNRTEYSEYVVTMEADCVHGLTGDDCAEAGGRISKFSEEWNIELQDEARGTYRLTRSVSATGLRSFDETGALADGREAWENARAYVLDTIGLGLKPERMVADGVIDGDSLQAFNYVRGEHVNETAGIYSVTESWVCFDPGGQAPATHEQTISCRTSAQDGRTSVSIEGSVQGLEVRDNTTHALVSTKAANAKTKWLSSVHPNLLTSATAGAASVGVSVALNAVPAGATIGQNDAAGTVTYQYEFDNRPSFVTPGALSEVVTIQNSHPADVFAEIPVPGRPLGPVPQPMATVTSRRRNISIEIQMPAATTTIYSTAPDTDGIILSLMPAGSFVAVTQNEETWVPAVGRYSRSVGFTWQA